MPSEALAKEAASFCQLGISMGSKRGRARSYELLPPGPQHIQLTLQESVIAEIEGAIDLLVRFRNFAGAHLLAAAATELIRARAKKLKITIIRDFFEQIRIFDEQTQNHIKYAMDFSYNSVKHSPGNDGVHVYFRPEFVRVHLMSAISMYEEIFGARTPKMATYYGWAMTDLARAEPELRERLEGLGAKLPAAPISETQLREFLTVIDEDPAGAQAMMEAQRDSG